MKRFTSLITCIAFLSTSALHAEEVPQQEEMSKQVGKAAEEGSSSGRNWSQYVIAGIAIAVAIVAIVLVSKDKGSS